MVLNVSEFEFLGMGRLGTGQLNTHHCLVSSPQTKLNILDIGHSGSSCDLILRFKRPYIFTITSWKIQKTSCSMAQKRLP